MMIWRGRKKKYFKCLWQARYFGDFGESVRILRQKIVFQCLSHSQLSFFVARAVLGEILTFARARLSSLCACRVALVVARCLFLICQHFVIVGLLSFGIFGLLAKGPCVDSLISLSRIFLPRSCGFLSKVLPHRSLEFLYRILISFQGSSRGDAAKFLGPVTSPK